MLTVEELENIKERLGKQFAKIVMEAHATLDAELVHLCSEVDSTRGEEHLKALGGDLCGLKKVIGVELDLSAVEILSALCRIGENTYGRCMECGADLPGPLLQSHPTERFCSCCRVNHRQLEHN